MLGTHIASFIIAPAHNLKSSGNGHRAFRFMNAFCLRSALESALEREYEQNVCA